MKSSRKSASARLLAVCAGVVVLTGPFITSRAFGATAVDANASLSDRLGNVPDSTMIQIGSLSTTLGAMRDAHRAREGSLSQAAALGQAAHGKLTTEIGAPAAVNTGATSTPKPVVEPPSEYASAPADMKAFCSAAAASACLYLPPNQVIAFRQGTYIDYDAYVTMSQCRQEGGTVEQAPLGPICAYVYPAGVEVHFKPAANYQLTRSAHCDKTLYSQMVDEHGVIVMQLTGNHNVKTGSDATCIVTVTPGG